MATIDPIKKAQPTPVEIFKNSVQLISEATDSRVFNRYLLELEQYVNSPIGQKQLSELNERQNKIPMTNRWKLSESDYRGKHAGGKSRTSGF